MTANNFPMTETVTYFEKPGIKNTDTVLALAKERADARGTTHVVVSSSTGATGMKAIELFKDNGVQVVVVTLHVGFKNEGEDRYSREKRDQIKGAGGILITAPHVLSGLERSMSRRYGGVSRTEAIADTLRSLFGHGMKVCVECALMAADAGAIPVGPGVEIMAMGGRGSGVDTAVILRPSHVNNFFATEIREIIAMPRLKHRSYEPKEG